MKDWAEMDLFERAAHVAGNAHRIFVRAMIGDDAKNIPMKELPDDDHKMLHLMRLISRAEEPHMVIKEKA